MSQEDPTRASIRVLIVDDSAFMRTSLSRMLASEADFEIVGTAISGSDALAKIPTLNPDVVTLDVNMPGIDGLECLRCIMTQFPRPVIMVSATTEKDAQTTFKALAAGAFDYVPKQLSASSLDIQHIHGDLTAKIRAAANAQRLRVVTPGKRPARSSQVESRSHSISSSSIVAIGASTGGPKALQEILPLLPQDLPVPILIVQHMPSGFTGPFAQRLNSLCPIAVEEAADCALLRPGVVYIAPAGKHMIVHRGADSRPIINLDTQPDNYLHIPSIDLMMKSVAETYRSHAMGVILTGMGSDGAEGMRSIQRHGGLTIGQDEASCTVYGMPRAAAEMGVLTRIVALAQIPAQIVEATQVRKRA